VNQIAELKRMIDSKRYEREAVMRGVLAALKSVDLELANIKEALTRITVQLDEDG
jgi:transcriptional regulator NrdR family protein